MSSQIDKRFSFLTHRHACIWTLPREKRDEIHSIAQSHQKPIIYVPYHVFAEATNAKAIYGEEVIKQGQNIEKLDTFLHSLAGHLPNVQGWHKFMHDFAFIPVQQPSDSEENNTIQLENENVTSKQSILPSDKESRLPKLSVRVSKQTEPISSASKQTEPIASTSKQLQSIGSKSKQPEPATPKLRFTESKGIDSVSSTPKKNLVADAMSKVPEIVRSPKKTTSNKDNDENRMRTTKDLGKRQVFMKRIICQFFKANS